MTKLISVIIPVYNRQAYLEECVRSVLAQTYPNFEIILVDDGSADGSAELCRTLSGQDSRIKFFAAEHGGVSAARNIALENAGGDYFFFLDSDDVIYPLLLETFLAAMEESGARIAGTFVAGVAAENWHKVQTKIAEVPVPGETTVQTPEETLDALLSGNSPIYCIGGVMMHRDLVGSTRFRTDLYIGEDFFFIYENVLKGTASVFLKQKWYYGRHHDTNLSWGHSFSEFWTRFYRRKLVWENEAALGRTEYADRQKREAIGSFLYCAERSRPYCADMKKIRQVMKEHKRILLPAAEPRLKLRFWIYYYVPSLHPAFLWVWNKIKKLRR